MNKKNISIVSNNFWTIYKFRLDIIDLLISKGYHVNLLAGKDSYLDKFNNPNITKIIIPMNERGMNLFQEISTFVKIYNSHKKLKPSLVFNFTLKSNIHSGLACKFLNLKYISMITGLGYIFIKNKYMVKKIISFLLSYSLKESIEVWFTNNFDKSYYIDNKILSNQLTRIIPGAGAVFSENEPSFVYQSNPREFIMIARLLKEKGVEEYLKTALHYKYDKNIKFMLIGSYKKDKNYISKKLLDEAISSNVIIYKEYVDNISPVIKDAACIILPSYREGMSTILLEAAVLKKPIITTKVPGCIDIIPNESYGTLCEPKDSGSLISAIDRFLKLSKKDLERQTNKTYEYVKKNYSRDKILEVYDSCLKYIE